MSNLMIDTLLSPDCVDNRRSCLMMAIKCARHLTGRDIKNGDAAGMTQMSADILMRDDVSMNLLEYESLFVGIATYLIALETIGCAFQNVNKSSNESNAIKRALAMFSSLDTRQMDAIKDLRNTLAHNFGLATEARSKRKYNHKFTLSMSDESQDVILPEKEWDGNFDNKDEQYSTKIGVFSFCNLMESIISKVIDCHSKGQLQLRIGENEAKARFTILTD